MNLFKIHMIPEQIQLNRETEDMNFKQIHMNPERFHMNQYSVHMDPLKVNMNLLIKYIYLLSVQTIGMIDDLKRESDVRNEEIDDIIYGAG